jgi:hypothetical protein
MVQNHHREFPTLNSWRSQQCAFASGLDGPVIADRLVEEECNHQQHAELHASMQDFSHSFSGPQSDLYAHGRCQLAIGDNVILKKPDAKEPHRR